VAYDSLGKEFVPELDEGQIMASTVMLPETSLAESNAMGLRVEEIFLSLPEVVSVSRTTGSAEGSEHVHPVNHSHYNVQLAPLEERDRGYDEIVADLRERLDDIPGIAYIFEQPIGNKIAEMLTGAEGALSVKLFGSDLDVLNAEVGRLRDVLAEIPGVADLQIEQTTGIPQLVIRLDRTRLARYGIPVAEVADLVETTLNGITVTDVYENDRMTSVLVRLEEESRQDEAAISRLLVDTPTGERIPLAELASIERGQGPQTIFRENLMRRKIILCNVEGRDMGRFVEEAQRAISEKIDLPPGYYTTFGGQFESQQRAMRHLTVVLMVVVLVIFVILLSTFGRVLEPVVIMLAIPLTLVGGVIGLALVGQTLNVSSTIGLIALFGIGIQNDVILIAKIKDLRERGADLRDAVVGGSLTKFRAILMTNLVMIVGVLPLALNTTTGAELHRPLAIVYIGGSIFAILLKMTVVPVLYDGMANLRRRWINE
jgi:cobalt-zinc-cadmium resistance protein CzcA